MHIAFRGRSKKEIRENLRERKQEVRYAEADLKRIWRFTKPDGYSRSYMSEIVRLTYECDNIRQLLNRAKKLMATEGLTLCNMYADSAGYGFNEKGEQAPFYVTLNRKDEDVFEIKIYFFKDGIKHIGHFKTKELNASFFVKYYDKKTNWHGGTTSLYFNKGTDFKDLYIGKSGRKIKM